MSDPKIIYKNKDFLVVDKPAGLLVHGARIGARKEQSVPSIPTLTDWLLKKYPEVALVGDDPIQRPGIVHRLDKETSGVMLVARNQESFEYLKSLFADRKVAKIYYALVYGIPKKKEGVIDTPIGIRNGTLKRSVRSLKMAKDAVTHYQVLKTWMASGSDGRERPFSLLKVSPKTGRTHQIRVHLMSIGYPIVGDPLYGPKKLPSWASRLMLHAGAISFPMKSGKNITFESPCPFLGVVHGGAK